MALYGDISHDSRVLREAESLSRAGHTVTVHCLAGSPAGDAPFRVVVHTPAHASVLPDGSSPFLGAAGRSLPARLLARVRWMVGYARTLRSWGRWAVDAAGPVDVWHAHDLTGLMAVAPLIRRPTRLVYDSHEIFLESGTGARLPGPIRRLMSWYERRLTRRAVALVTVNEGCAEVLTARLRPRETVVVRNCPPRWSPAGEVSKLREATGVSLSQPLVLYHGAFMADRGIDQLAEAMATPELAGAHLALLGYGPARTHLEALAEDPRFAGRLHVLDAVSPGELLAWVSGADVDVMPIQRSTLNHWLGTPNRLWESLAAGVPVVASDFPVMRRVVLDDPDGPLGAVCDPSSSAAITRAIREVIERPIEERAELRARCRRAAHERWNWETEGGRLIDLYERIEVA